MIGAEDLLQLTLGLRVACAYVVELAERVERAAELLAGRLAHAADDTGTPVLVEANAAGGARSAAGRRCRLTVFLGEGIVMAFRRTQLPRIATRTRAAANARIGRREAADVRARVRFAVTQFAAELTGSLAARLERVRDAVISGELPLEGPLPKTPDAVALASVGRGASAQHDGARGPMALGAQAENDPGHAWLGLARRGLHTRVPALTVELQGARIGLSSPFILFQHHRTRELFELHRDRESGRRDEPTEFLDLPRHECAHALPDLVLEPALEAPAPRWNQRPTFALDRTRHPVARGPSVPS